MYLNFLFNRRIVIQYSGIVMNIETKEYLGMMDLLISLTSMNACVTINAQQSRQFVRPVTMCLMNAQAQRALCANVAMRHSLT